MLTTLHATATERDFAAIRNYREKKSGREIGRGNDSADACQLVERRVASVSPAHNGDTFLKKLDRTKSSQSPTLLPSHGPGQAIVRSPQRRQVGWSSLITWTAVKRLGVLFLLAGRGLISAAEPFSFAKLCDTASPKMCQAAARELARRDVAGRFANNYDSYQSYFPIQPLRESHKSKFGFGSGPKWNSSQKFVTGGKHGPKVYAPVDIVAHEWIHQQHYQLTPRTTVLAANLHHPLLANFEELRTERLREQIFSKDATKQNANPRLYDGAAESAYVRANDIYDDSIEHAEKALQDLPLRFTYARAVAPDLPSAIVSGLPNAAELDGEFWRHRARAGALLEKLRTYPSWEAAIAAGFPQKIAAYEQSALIFLQKIEKLERAPSANKPDLTEL